MTKRTSLMMFLTVLVVSLNAAFLLAANTAKNHSAPNQGVQTSISTKDWKQGVFDAELNPSTSRSTTPALKPARLGYLMSTNGLLDLGVATEYENQSNQSQQREIVVNGAGRVYSVWTHIDAGPSARDIGFATYVPGAVTLPAVTTATQQAGEGFPAVDYYRAGASINKAVQHSHLAARGTYGAEVLTIGGISFTTPALYPDTSHHGCFPTGGFHEGTYIWPASAADVSGASGFTHVVALESPWAAPSPVDSSGYQTLVYYRSQNDSYNPSGTCGVLIDSVTALAYSICADPNSNKVAIVYAKPRKYLDYFTGIGPNDDVYYKESTDGGATWPATPTVIYKFGATQGDGASSSGAGFVERAWEVSALYGSVDNCLHVLFKSAWLDTVTFGNRFSAKLYHWSSCAPACVSVVKEAHPQNPFCTYDGISGAINNVSLTECTIGGQQRLYAIYAGSFGDADDSLASFKFRDCSDSAIQNSDIWGNVSINGGQTWGPDSNLTATAGPNGCHGLGAGCNNEIEPSSPVYVNDTIRVQYIQDMSPGFATSPRGGTTDNEVFHLTRACFGFVSTTSLAATPNELKYPFHTTPSGIKDTVLTITNLGNLNTPFTASTSPVASWISYPGGASGNCPAGCSNTTTFTVRATGPVGEGLYTTTLNLTYSKSTQAVVAIPIELYNFSSWFLPQDVRLRTTTNSLVVEQVSRASAAKASPTAATALNSYHYFADAADFYYLFDGSLIMGNSVSNLSWQIFEGGSGAGPTVTNPFGYLYALSNNAYPGTGGEDTNSSPALPSYRHTSGKGTNRDTTLGFTVNWYASKHPDSSDFYVGDFKLYKGTKNPAGSVTGLTVAYAVDWDIPSDSAGSRNTAGLDAANQLIYQQGWLNAPFNQRYGGLAALRNDNVAIPGGFVWQNDVSVYPVGGFENDTVWNKMAATSGYTKSDSALDLNSVLVLYKNATINGATNDTLRFYVMFAGQRLGTVAGLQGQIARAKKFICTYLNPTGAFCTVCTCGDANGDHTINISDAVFLIQYIFGGGAAPNPLCNGDANGDHTVNISDAVFLIQYIFGGGPAPAGCA